MTERRTIDLPVIAYISSLLFLLAIVFSIGYVMGMKRMNAEYKKSFNENFYAIGVETVLSLYSPGLAVSEVYSGTPAEKAGIRKSDVILSVNFGDATFTRLEAIASSATEVRLEIRRGDQIFRVLVIPELVKRKTILIPIE